MLAMTVIVVIVQAAITTNAMREIGVGRDGIWSHCPRVDR